VDRPLVRDVAESRTHGDNVRITPAWCASLSEHHMGLLCVVDPELAGDVGVVARYEGGQYDEQTRTRGSN
jgi:hypothetical protein